MDYKAFAERTKHKTFDELLHEGKRQAHELLEDQGVAALASYIAEIMPQSLKLNHAAKTDEGKQHGLH